MTVFGMLIKFTYNYKQATAVFILLNAFLFSPIFANEGLEIDSPKFSEKGLDDRLYEIKAEKGIQTVGNLELFTIEGKLRTDSGIWIYLNAEKGNFNQLENLIELSGKIYFYTDENDKFHSDQARLSLDKNLVEFYKNVKHIKGSNIVTADTSKIKNNFNHVIYQGNVRTLYITD
mgnify:CR=1 FL=1